jgi:multiple antibiotic resistance protein
MGDLVILKSVLLLFAIVNPIGSIPIFLQLTQNMSSLQRKNVFQTGVSAAALILFIFLVAGKWILSYVFQIRLSDLMAAGGLLLIIIAIDHLIFGSLVKGVLSGKEEGPNHIGAVPIACPILAGPGAMMTVLVIYTDYGFAPAAIAIIAVIAITWLIFNFIDSIYKILGKTVCTVLSKILSLFIAAIGIRFLMEGLLAYFR